MKHTLACLCGHEQECPAEDQCPGSAYRCGGCRTVWGCLRTKRGVPVWVRVAEREVEFHGLLEEPEPEGAEDNGEDRREAKREAFARLWRTLTP